MIDYSSKIYFTVRDAHHDVTRLVVESVGYAHALADALNDMGYRASHVPSTCTTHFHREVAELERANAILDEVVRVKGGLSIVDLKS